MEILNSWSQPIRARRLAQRDSAASLRGRIGGTRIKRIGKDFSKNALVDLSLAGRNLGLDKLQMLPCRHVFPHGLGCMLKDSGSPLQDGAITATESNTAISLEAHQSYLRQLPIFSACPGYAQRADPIIQTLIDLCRSHHQQDLVTLSLIAEE